MKYIFCVVLLCCLSQVYCGIYSLYANNRNIFHDLTKKDKAQRGNIVGEKRQVDINDKHVTDLLNEHLGRLITEDDSKFLVDQIDEISKQTVAGVSYRIKGHFQVEGDKKDCTVTILERVWHETEKVIISANCEDGSCYVTETYTCPPQSFVAF
ncbi:CLUMA_CG014206, isoform A [Clunio marinus]|uniref:CLUMA_CG014206, isoform A n=1 Tax=Clunio marinus TaxID=568069 RepID=A0A1J1IMR0_9DIPT|nr:CLUMA_CG014206, isoform A [Clunio marinus]